MTSSVFDSITKKNIIHTDIAALLKRSSQMIYSGKIEMPQIVPTKIFPKYSMSVGLLKKPSVIVAQFKVKYIGANT